MKARIHYKRVIIDVLVLSLMATIPFISNYASAEENKEEQPFVNFTDPLKLSRGQLNPVNPESLISSDSLACEIIKDDWGWGSCSTVEKLIFDHVEGVDSTLITIPDSQGYVEFDDWKSSNKDAEIDEIWDSFVEASKEQSKRAGVEIKPVRWVVYPTLDEENKVLYYAFLVKWGSESFINIKASIFDRRGYVPFMIVPKDPNLSEDEIRLMVKNTAYAYSPNQADSYKSFSSGDKIAAAGVLGTLATLVGVKYGKGFFATAIAIALAFAKKLWFLIFLPFIYIGKLFKKKDS